MVIAALVCFAILLVAWIVAPTDAPSVTSIDVVPAPELAALPEAA